jgi:hypothetical protein
VFALLSLAALVPAADPLSLKDGDRIVWIGNTLVEREQRYGYWETALQAAVPDKAITFRNLGWSGDTVFGDSRAGFDTPAQGFQRLVGLTLELKPTVIIVSYGMNEAFEGLAGLPRFVAGLEKLLDALSPANARIVLTSPIDYESRVLRVALEPSQYSDLKAYAGAIGEVASKRKLRFADLDKAVKEWKGGMNPRRQVTYNGMHLAEDGYRTTASMFVSQLGIPIPNKPGRNSLATQEQLREAVVAKNELFFHRWRPQNETYLFGFRKHEQGKNAKEVAEFDPLVDQAEKEINRIKKDLPK